MPICSQLPVLLGKSGKPGYEPEPRGSSSACGVWGRGSCWCSTSIEHHWCKCSGLGLLAHQIGGCVKSQAGNCFLSVCFPLPAAGVYLGSGTLHHHVLHSHLVCNPICWLSPAPKGSNTWIREEMRICSLQSPSGAHFSLYQQFLPRSFAKAIGERSQEIRGTRGWAAAGSTELCARMGALQLSSTREQLSINIFACFGLFQWDLLKKKKKKIWEKLVLGNAHLIGMLIIWAELWFASFKLTAVKESEWDVFEL